MLALKNEEMYYIYYQGKTIKTISNEENVLDALKSDKGISLIPKNPIIVRATSLFYYNLIKNNDIHSNRIC